MEYKAIGLESRIIYATGTHADCSRVVNEIVSDKRLYRPDERAYGNINHSEAIRIVPINEEIEIEPEKKLLPEDDEPDGFKFRGWTSEQMEYATKHVELPNKELIVLLIDEFGERASTWVHSNTA